MSSYMWAIGFDWNESNHAKNSPRLLATMCLAVGGKVVKPRKRGDLYRIDYEKGDALDLSFFDRTKWPPKATPGADAFRFPFCKIVFGKSEHAPPGQSAHSPVGVKSDLADDLVSDLSVGETTPCFANEVSGHAWDGGLYPLLHNGLFELTISFDVFYDGKLRHFQKDPEMEVSGVSG